MDTILTGRPSVVVSNWKSTAHTLFGASAVAGVGCCRALPDPLPAAVLRDPEVFVAPQPLNLLVVHRPALTAASC